MCSNNFKSEKRLAIIDFARTISILSVMAYHFGFDVTKPNSLLSNALFVASRNGRYGVSIFFVISGFVISRMVAMRYGGLFKLSVSDFYIRRASRIWPLIIVSVTLGLCFVEAAQNYSLPVSSVPYQLFSPKKTLFDGWYFLSLCTFTLNWLVIQRWMVYGLHFSILWSVAIEEQFYFFYPFLLQHMKVEKNLIKFLVVVILLGPIARWYGTTLPDPVLALSNSFGAFDLLAIGIFLFISHQKWSQSLRERQPRAALLCLLGLIVACLAYFDPDANSQWHLVFGPSLLGLGVFSILLSGLSLEIFERLPRILTYPGFLSYGMYIYHPFCLLCTACLVKLNFRPAVFICFVLIDLAISTFSFYMFEQPINRLICKRFSKIKTS